MAVNGMDEAAYEAGVRLFIRVRHQGEHAAGLGKGIVELCELVDDLGSLNRAAKEMGMAYSKAWKIVKNTEQALGFELFVRRGASGSSLTNEARELIGIYRSVEQEAWERANELLQRKVAAAKERGLLGGRAAPAIETEASPDLIAQVRSLDFPHLS